MTSRYVIVRERAEKIVRYKTPRGREVCLTREVYLRDDISCKSLECSNMDCRSSVHGHLLPKGLHNYIVVDGFYALNYWEIFESEKIKGLIISLSSANFVQQQAVNKRPYGRIKATLDDPVQTCVIFDNEFHKSCFRSPFPDESFRDYTTRMNWIVACWYQTHLNGTISIIFITDNKKYVEKCASKTYQNEGVIVLDLPGLLQAYYPDLTAAKLLYDSLTASLVTQSVSKQDENRIEHESNDEKPAKSNDLPSAPESGQVYPPHLPDPALLAGLRSGQFLRGALRVSRFRPQTEAMVILTDASVVKHQPELKEALAARSEIIVHGLQHRNRAVDGDLVVVRLLPRLHWKPVSSNISGTENCIAEVITNLTGSSDFNPAQDTVDVTSNGPEGENNNYLPCGFVVGIISRNWRDYVCTYTCTNDAKAVTQTGWITVTPWDRRVPRILIHTTQASKLSSERFVVRIDSWDAGSNHPHGHFVHSLGCIGDLETETQTLLIEHNIAIRAFTDSQLAELTPLRAQRPWTVDPDEVKMRRDLRSPALSGNPNSEDVLIFSIDPPGCQDVDDALSARLLSPIECEDGTQHRRLQLGVHIADVTYFLPPGTFIDAEARRRATSVYLADRRYDMLPGLLSGDLCSLWSGVDRYAVSVLWEIDMETLDVLDIWYGRTVIRSNYKMTYDVAQRIFSLNQTIVGEDDERTNKLIEKLGGRESVGQQIPELAKTDLSILISSLKKLKSSLELLVEIASSIRVRRIAKGGLELDSIEVSVRFADPDTRTGKLEDLITKEPLPMHNTVAELMIFANHWVARRCLESFPDQSCLRCHPPPRPEYFDELKRCMSMRGFRLDTTSNCSLANSLGEAEDPNDPEVNKVIRQLVTRAMTNALYFSTGSTNFTREQFAHYGLALNLYTHFTSPIRRYADVIVHRLLLAALGDLRSMPLGESDAPSKQLSEPEVVNTDHHHQQLMSADQLSAVCRHMNEQHWAAQQVQRASVTLFQSLFFRDKPDDDPSRLTDAIITQLRGANGFVVLVPRYGIRGAVCVKNAKNQIAWADYTKSDSGEIVWHEATANVQVERVYPNGSANCGYLSVRNQLGVGTQTQTYNIFDHVLVRITVHDSIAHGLGLHLQLTGRPRPRENFEQQGKLLAESANQVSVSSSDKIVDEASTVNANLIEAVHTKDAERRLKRALDTDQTENDSKLGRYHLIAKLHESTSLYHQFHKLLRQCKPEDNVTNS